MTDEATDTLSAEEQAYFDSRGEAEVKPAPEVEKPEPEVVEAEVETAEDDEVAVDPPKVPLAALTKERQAAKELKSRLAEMEKRHAVLEDRWNTLLKVQEPAPVEAVADDPEPDPEKDIFAHSAWQARQLKAVTEAIKAREQTEAQAKAASEEDNAIWSLWKQSATAFKSEKPDFDEAVKFLSDARLKQMQAYAVVDERFGDEGQRVAQLNAELKQIVKTAKAKSINPADAVYQIATTYGYAPKAAVNTEQLERLEKAIDGSTSLSSVGGSRPAPALDAKAIADMSPGEFEAWFAKPGNQQKFKRLAGG
jgi:hypothetical protein